MTRMWAVEKYIGHWDGYSGEASAFQPNNYYLYSDPSGPLPDAPLGHRQHLGAVQANRVRRRSGAALRRLPGRSGLLPRSTGRRCAVLQGTVAGLGLDSLALKTAALLKPWEEEEQAQRQARARSGGNKNRRR